MFAEQRELFAKNLDEATRFLGVGDSEWDDALPLAEFTATTTVVSAIMNLEEFVVVK